jgi:hypothetical protein
MFAFVFLLPGLNVHTTFRMPDTYILPLRSAVEKGKVSMDVLNQRVREVLYVKFWLGMVSIIFVLRERKGEGRGRISVRVNTSIHHVYFCENFFV